MSEQLPEIVRFSAGCQLAPLSIVHLAPAKRVLADSTPA